jgi:pyruvate dehydrogenase E1 component beta subunit
MMHTALRDDNFTVFLINKNTAGIGFLGRPTPTTMSNVPEGDYVVPFGEAKVVREGSHVSLVGLGWTVHQSLNAADILAEQGISAEVVDIRSLVPLDRETILQSVRKTGRLVVADEDYLSYGLSGEVIASVVERDHHALRAPAERVCFPDVPIPYAREMEDLCLPHADKIVAAALRSVKGS